MCNWVSGKVWRMILEKFKEGKCDQNTLYGEKNYWEKKKEKKNRKERKKQKK